MYYALYIDVLFLENLLLDYLLLTITARLMKLAPGVIRRSLSAALGSLLFCLACVFLPRCPAPVFLLLHAAAAAVMAWSGLGIRDLRSLGKALILLYLCSFLLGGIFGWLQRVLRLPVYPFLGLSLISCWLLSLGMSWLMRFRRERQRLYPVTISFRGRSVRTRGLIDTGNALRDPVFGKPVSVLDPELQLELLGAETPSFILCLFTASEKKPGCFLHFTQIFFRLRQRTALSAR